METKYKALFCVPPKGPAQTEGLIAKIPDAMGKYISSYKFVKDMDEYAALSDDDKKV